jgi:hypothetical protein
MTPSTQRLPVIQAQPDDIAESYRVEAESRTHPQVRVPIVHSLHGGVYTRTARIPAGVTITSVMIAPPTTIIATGDWAVLQGGEWVLFTGFRVLPAAPGRRQIIKAITECTLTLVFPCAARTVQEAEQEMSPEWRLLQSQDGHGDTIINTHQENPCQESAQAPPFLSGPE